MANNILITRNKGIQKQEILLLEFCKNTQNQRGQREQTMSTMSTQQSTCFCCWDYLSYGLNTLGQLCLWQCLIFRHRLASSLVCSDWPSIIIEAAPQIHLSIQHDSWELNDLHGWCSIPLSSNCFHSCRVSRDRTSQSIVRCITTVRQRERHKTAGKQYLLGEVVEPAWLWGTK